MDKEEISVKEAQKFVDDFALRSIKYILLAYVAAACGAVMWFGFGWWVVLLIPLTPLWLYISGAFLSLFVPKKYRHGFVDDDTAEMIALGKQIIADIEQFKDATTEGERIFLIDRIREKAISYYELGGDPTEEFRISESSKLITLHVNDDITVAIPDGVLAVILETGEVVTYSPCDIGGVWPDKDRPELFEKYVFTTSPVNATYSRDGKIINKRDEYPYYRIKNKEPYVDTVTSNG